MFKLLVFFHRHFHFHFPHFSFYRGACIFMNAHAYDLSDSRRIFASGLCAAAESFRERYVLLSNLLRQEGTL